ALRAERDRIESALDDARARASETLRDQIADARRRIEAQIRAREERAIGDVERQLAPRRAALEVLRAKLVELRAAEAAFRDWLPKRQGRPARHAAARPPPPTSPALPSDAELAELARPIAPPARDASALPSLDVSLPSIAMPAFDLPEEPHAVNVRFGRLP